MDQHDYQYAVGLALSVRAKAFDLGKVLREYHERTKWFSHFLCEANRQCAMGLGGSAFRCWYAGLYREGVYLFSDTYRPGLVIASNPSAKVSLGCQDSCCHGDPCPRLSDGARWVSVFQANIPEALRQRCIGQATDMARQAASQILRVAWRIRAKEERESADRREQHVTMLGRWGCLQPQ